MSKPSLLSELKRRNVLRGAAFYAAGAWLLVEIATQVLPFFGVPDTLMRWIVIAAVAGFPFAMAFSWFYEWTPRGIYRESAVDSQEPVRLETGRQLDRWIIIVLGVAVILLLADTFMPRTDTGAIHDTAVAVLPLANESGDKDQLYFSDGLSEDLITALSRVEGLTVVSRNSSFQFRDSKDDSRTIGARLGAAHLLEGSVRRAGKQVRINLELIETTDGSTLWSQTYDRPYGDLFALQDEITTAVASALKTTLLPGARAPAGTGRPASGNLDAYTAYLQGRFYEARNTAADFRRAIDCYAQATQLDPHYALAFAAQSLLSTRHAGRFLEGAAMLRAYERARSAAETALSLDPDLAEAHLARGRLIVWEDSDWAGGQAEYRRALELAPGNEMALTAVGEMLATLGHPAEAITTTRRALAIDMLNAHTWHLLATYLMPLGRLDEAEGALRKAIELQPKMPGNYEQLAIIEILRGDAAGALRVARQEHPGNWRDNAVARALQIGDDPAAAAAALATMIRTQAKLAAYQIAQVQAVRQDAGEVFEWLDRAHAARDPGVGLLLYDPLLLPYRNDPRFAAFCREVGLPAPDATMPVAAATQSTDIAVRQP
ncbi:tetratricopeptide repeat protein [Dokdonella sp.]|uniref:tetratricopeptide repeat protein n=1 Tax=Dokdonella sp. TaxID=2291710 RepID=UPI0031C58807|nr:hypothetical protein [Dokdonella sp.]